MTSNAHPGETSRLDAIELAHSYLQGGLVAHDTVEPRLAPTCFRHENGWSTGDEGVIRAHFPNMTMCLAVRGERWLVELPYAAVRFELVLDERHGGTKGVTELFRIGADGIEEVGAVFPLARWTANAVGPATDAARAVHPIPQRAGREAATVAAGKRLLDAVATGGETPLGPDATLSENGVLLARTPGEARTWLDRFLDPAQTDTTALQWVAEGNEAIGRLEVEVTDGTLRVVAIYVRTHGDLVREIDVAWGPGPGPRLIEAWSAELADQPG